LGDIRTLAEESKVIRREFGRLGCCHLLASRLENSFKKGWPPGLKTVLLVAVAALGLKDEENQEELVRGNVCHNVVKMMGELKSHDEILQNG